jgi:hypothetical protein
MGGVVTFHEIGGVEWCERHQGVRNEDSNVCDMYDPRDPDDDQDGPCNTVPVYWFEWGEP